MRRVSPLLVLPAALLGLLPGAGHAARGATGTIVFAADRLPTASGEIYRIGPNGRRVDLSRSPAPDFAATVSTSGRSVAFASLRGGRAAVYLVGLDGRGLRRISPFLYGAPGQSSPYPVTLAWSPDSRRLTAVIDTPPGSSRLYLGGPRVRWRLLSKGPDPLTGSAGWSPDGRLLAYVTNGSGVHVVTPDGREQWGAAGLAAVWSARGRLAVSANAETVQVLDEAGHARGSFRGVAPVWSPNGDLLASLTASGRLQVRAGGVGRPRVDVALRGHPQLVQWLGPEQLRLFGETGWFGYDLRTRRVVTLPAAYAQYSSVPYVDGSRVVADVADRARSRLQVATPTGAPRTLDSGPPCGDAPTFDRLQFVPGGRTVVYETACPEPPADIYAVDPGTRKVTRLTSTVTDETQPAVSPDRARLAYVQQATVVGCHGCPETVWLAHADGSSAQQLPSADAAANTPYDDAPSFSPDGATLLFARGGPDSTRLLSAPVTGGPARDLGVPGLRPVWGPQRIAYASWPGGAWTTAAPDGTAQQPAGLPTPRTIAVAWSPSGTLAGLAWRASRLSIEIAGRAKQIPLPGLAPPLRGAGLAWSPDGTALAFTAVDRDGAGDVYTVAVDGSHLARLTHGLGAITGLAWR